MADSVKWNKVVVKKTTDPSLSDIPVIWCHRNKGMLAKLTQFFIEHGTVSYLFLHKLIFIEKQIKIQIKWLVVKTTNKYIIN